MALSPKSPWTIISNSHAGSGLAPCLLKDVLSRISTHLPKDSAPPRVYETQSEGDCSRIGVDVLRERTVHAHETDDTVNIVLIGGDGTLHELVNGVMREQAGEKGKQAAVRWNVVLVASGTANAVYHSLFPQTCDPEQKTTFNRFLSLEAALALSETPPPSSGKLQPVSILAVHTDREEESPAAYYSHVVTSTALHAHILETASLSEWRREFPGTERFRKAAEKHFGTVYEAELELLPFSDHSTASEARPTVQKWDPATSAWRDAPASDSGSPLRINGLFTYFVASLVDRFEALFQITPQSSSSSRPAGAVDVLFLRTHEGETSEARAQKLLSVLNAAYEKGRHVQMRDEETGEAIVEYYRTGGFAWRPANEDTRLVCVDGTTFRLDADASLECRVLPPSGQSGFFIYT